MVYGRYNELVNGVYKPTYNWGAPSCREWMGMGWLFITVLAMKWIIPENSLRLAPVRLVVIFHKCSKWDSRGATHVAKKINWQWSCDPLHEQALYPYGMSFFMVCAVFDKTFSWWQASVNCCCMFPNQFLPKMFCGYRVFSFSLRKIKAESFKGTILSKLVVTENPWKIDTGQTKDICLELPGGIVILSKTNQDLDGSILRVYMPIYFRMFMPVGTWICVISHL